MLIRPPETYCGPPRCSYSKPVYDPPHEIPWMNVERLAYRQLLNCPCHPNRNVYDEFNKLVPIDLQNIQNPSELSGENQRVIAQTIAQFSLQGLVEVAWTGLYKYASIDDGTFARFREIFFESFTNHVLCIYDMEDFQRWADRIVIERSCMRFLDYLKYRYGEEPKSALRALADISQEKLPLDKFPFLWDEDVASTLEYYYHSCRMIELYDFPIQVKLWPPISFFIFEEIDVYEHHVKSVMKVLKEHVPLKDNEKRDLLINMEFEAGEMANALSLECLKEIRYEDFEKLSSKEEDLYSPEGFLDFPFLQAIAKFSKKKRDAVRNGNKNVIFPLKSGVFGNFTAEVGEVIRLANVERRIVGQRFLSGNLILSVVLRSRIGDRARHFLVEWEQTVFHCTKEYNEGNSPVYYIYRLAGDIAATLLAGSGSVVVKVEHVFLATLFAQWRQRGWELFLAMPLVSRFLEACKSEATASSSPDRKKMKHSEDYDEIEDTPLLSLNEEETDQGPSCCRHYESDRFMQELSHSDEEECEEPDEKECEEPIVRTQKEEFLLCCTAHYLWTPEFMKQINNAFKRDTFDVRKMIFGLQEEAGERGWCKRKKKFSWENIVSRLV